MEKPTETLLILKGLLGNQENPLFLPTLQHPNTAWTLVGLFSSLSVLFLGHFFIFYSLFFFFFYMEKKKSDTDSFILKSGEFVKVRPLMCPLTVFLEHKSQTSNCSPSRSPPPPPDPHPTASQPWPEISRKLKNRVLSSPARITFCQTSPPHCPPRGIKQPAPPLSPPHHHHIQTPPPPTVTQFGGDEVRTIVSTTGREARCSSSLALLAFRRCSHLVKHTH